MKIDTLHIHIGDNGPGPAFASLLAMAAITAITGTAPPSVPKEPAAAAVAVSAIPRIGEYWPGQGGIYVGMGRGYNGAKDHHLILPTDPRAIFANRALGTYGTDVTGASSDDDGMANTLAYAAAGSDLCKEILALEIDGHKDLYLMSRTDARLCMANVPELFEKEWYLTSTQYSAITAWGQDFDGGTQGSSVKKAEARARAVRRLIL